MRTNTKNDIIVKTIIEHAHELRRASDDTTAQELSRIINELENGDHTKMHTVQLLNLIRCAEISLHQDKQIKRLREEIEQIKSLREEIVQIERELG